MQIEAQPVESGTMVLSNYIVKQFCRDTPRRWENENRSSINNVRYNGEQSECNKGKNYKGIKHF